MLIISILINILFLCFLIVIGARYSWPNKFAERIGWKAKTKPKDYYTTISWTKSLESLNCRADVVFFGASLISNGRWHEYFDSINVCNLGKSGDELQTMLWRVPQITILHPYKIFVAMEQNDLHTQSVESIKAGLQALLNVVKQNNSQAEVFLFSLTPLNKCQFERVCNNDKIKQVNEQIHLVANEMGMTYINIYDIYEENGQLPMSLSYDGQHLMPDAYKRWVDVVSQYITN